MIYVLFLKRKYERKQFGICRLAYASQAVLAERGKGIPKPSWKVQGRDYLTRQRHRYERRSFLCLRECKKARDFSLAAPLPHLARLKRAQNQITKDPLPAFLFNLKIKKERIASTFYENIIFAQNNLLKFLLRPLFSKKRAVQSKKGRKTAPFYDTIKFYQTNNRSFLPFWQAASAQLSKTLHIVPDY